MVLGSKLRVAFGHADDRLYFNQLTAKLINIGKRLYNDVRQENNPLGGYEEVPPHVNSYEFSLHFRVSNKQRAA